MRPSATWLAERFRANQAGATAALFALLIPVFVGMAALVIDLNNARAVQRRMQMSADAAVLAASMDIGSASVDPNATATNYSAVSGGANAIPGVTVVMASGYPLLACLKNQTTFGLCVHSAAAKNDPSSGADTIFVKETASVPTIFSKYFGLSSIPISVSSAAAGHGGNSKQLDVMIVLDTTGSMTSPDPACGNISRLACAENGVQTLLKTLAPSVDQVGLMVYPGLTAATAGYDSDCSSSAPTSVPYNKSPVYLIVGLANDYRTSDSATTLNTSSSIVRAVGAGGAGCSNGITDVAGQKTFYADAVTAAQTYLQANGRTGAQKVIIVLSDGDANAPTAPTTLNECGQAVAAAASAKALGTWVYTIGYGAGTGGTCSYDTSPKTTACATLASMATDSAHFFYDGTLCSNGQPITSLQSAFQQVGNSLMAPMLIPFNSV